MNRSFGAVALAHQRRQTAGVIRNARAELAVDPERDLPILPAAARPNVVVTTFGCLAIATDREGRSFAVAVAADENKVENIRASILFAREDGRRW